MQGDQSWKRTERLRTYGHLINLIMAYDNIVLYSMSKFYLERRTQISAGIVREWGIGNRELGSTERNMGEKVGGKMMEEVTESSLL